MITLAILAGLLIGLWRGTIQRVDMRAYTGLIGQTVTLRGTISEDPSVGNSGELKLRLDNVSIDEHFLPGQVWVSVSGRMDEVKRSDVVEVEGKLKQGFGTFPASMTYAHLASVERRAGSDPAREVRDWFGDNLRKVVKEPEADLGMGILAGQKTALPLSVSDAFRIAGLTHIVVASGYNLTILVRFSRRLFARISRFAAASGAGVMVFCFACVTGFSPSMSRAAIVAGLSLLTWYYGRKTHPFVLLVFVAAVTAMYNPMYVWGDVGWYMSFASFAGVIMLSPLIQDYFWSKKEREKVRKLSRKKEPKPSAMRQIFVDTMSAQICVEPIIALAMGQFAPFGMLANLLVLPIVPLAMLLTFIAGAAAWLLPIGIAQVVGWPSEFLLSYIIKIAEWVADLPGALQEVQFDWITCVLYYLLLVFVCWWMWRVTKHKFRDDQLVE